MEGNVQRLAAGDGEVAALDRLQPHPHGGDVALDGVDELLVRSFVVCDETKVVCVWKSDGGRGFAFSV